MTTNTRPRTAIKEAIRSVRTTGQDATESDVLEAAAANSSHRLPAVQDAYEQLRREGEIYSYPSGGVVVVRITNEVLS